MPLKIRKERIYCQPKNIFLLKDQVFLAFQVFGLNPELEQKGNLIYEFFKGEELVFSTSRSVTDYQDKLNFK